MTAPNIRAIPPEQNHAISSFKIAMVDHHDAGYFHQSMPQVLHRARETLGKLLARDIVTTACHSHGNALI